MSAPEPMVPVKHLASLNRSTLPEDTAADYEFAYVDIGSVTTGEMSIPEKTIAFSEAPSRARRLARPGDVVISTVRTYLRAVAQVPSVDADLVFSTGFAVVHPEKDKVDGRYLAYAMQADPFTEAVEAMSVGISYPAVNASDVGNVKVWAPSMDKQRAVADFLDRETAQIDAMVDAQERLVGLLEERRAGAILRAVTAGLNGGRVQEADLGWTSYVPEGWDTVRIGLRWRIVAGVSLSGHRAVDDDDGGNPYLRAANIQPHGVDLSTVKRLHFTPVELSALTLRQGDLLVVEGGQGGYGRSAVLRTDLYGWGYQNHVMRVRPTHGDSNSFLDYVLKAARAAGYIFALSGHAAIPVFSAEKLAAIRIGLPSHAEQAEVVKYLDGTTARIDAMIAKARESIALMKERRAAVISAAVTGRIDVRTGIEQVERDLEEARV